MKTQPLLKNVNFPAVKRELPAALAYFQVILQLKRAAFICLIIDLRWLVKELSEKSQWKYMLPIDLMHNNIAIATGLIYIQLYYVAM